MDASDHEKSRAILRDWLVRNRPPDVAPVFDPRPCSTGTAADLPMRPGPQAWNGGLTPGFVPERSEGDPATLADLRAVQMDGLSELIDDVRKAIVGLSELSVWLAEVERRLADEIELRRYEGEHRGTAGRSDSRGGSEGRQGEPERQAG